MRKLLPVVVALLCACEPEVAPPPAFHILDLSPRQQTNAEPQIVTVRLDLEPRFLVNYGERSARMVEQPRLKIGGQTVPLDTYLGHGQFQGTVGAGLEVGRYDIQVVLEDGREASLPEAYEVKPYLTFWFDSIAPQVQDQPFLVTMRVTGPDVEHYEGSVGLSLYKGSLDAVVPMQPDRCGPFSGGMCQVQVTIDTPGEVFLLVMTDEQGRTTNSNSFPVAPKN